ncbi:sulfite exporter TauE/SafE family protein [Shewanella sp. OMA3-2]|uniref:sulfite exporter TauE/SafE family protein n=1 Tax=Shewanella sp. OMA3-2 TaxID=2908650 RepID=UPI001F3697C7|nr:sulfite exporter TauE/SafE family protein [Shewanella sp. OMA3-2]UJF23102.1 sulfite exporter TauE/SafE family protein [Shewanella sp. OMA3-2]
MPRPSLIAAFILFSFWLLWAWYTPNIAQLLINNSFFVLLGICGAVFASATGAGGGVIFIPAFSTLGFSPEEAISTSFLVQCFGMTAGALTWCHHYIKQHHHNKTWHGFITMITCCSIFSIAGLWCSKIMHINAPASLHTSFSLFSIILGSIIILNSLKKPSSDVTTQFGGKPLLDCAILCGIGFIGGIITAWLSVGVGEIAVIYLMLRGYCTKLSIAVGVVVSAVTVWSATPITLSPDSLANFEVLLFAGPGALIGGLIAKRVALFFSVMKLKLFFAIWIILTGTVMLFIA